MKVEREIMDCGRPSRRALLAGAAAFATVGSKAAAEETHTVEAGDTLQSLADLHGVSVEDLAAANGLNVDDPVAAGQELIMPGGGGPAEAGESSASLSGGVEIAGTPVYQQSRPLSCEAASVYIATTALGAPVAEDDTIESTPFAQNPHLGYRGSYDGVWGGTDDYGVYAEALVPHLEAHGFSAAATYVPDPDTLRRFIDAGAPVLIWIATRGDTGFYETDEEGTQFKLVPYVHVVVAFGYNDSEVIVSDPGSGAYSRFTWDWLIEAWAVLDGMALAISRA
jgi:uncharacterized protein YvpB